MDVILLNELCSFKPLKLQRFCRLGAARCVQTEIVLIFQHRGRQIESKFHFQMLNNSTFGRRRFLICSRCRSTKPHKRSTPARSFRFVPYAPETVFEPATVAGCWHDAAVAKAA
jgi:hypothetical protein